MKYSLSLLNFDYLGDLQLIAELGVEAEQAGWDAVFLSDHVNWPDMDTAGLRLGGHYVDPWIALGLIADRTDQILIGTAVTPLARRRPTKLAREILTLHRFSGGRFVLGAGSGIWPTEFDDFGDPGDLKVRAEMLDEGLELLQKTWGGDDFEHRGKHYQARGRTFCPGGADIPVWVAASWPSKKPFRRAAQYDGVMVMNNDYANPVSFDDVREIRKAVQPWGGIEFDGRSGCGHRTCGGLRSRGCRLVAGRGVSTCREPGAASINRPAWSAPRLNRGCGFAGTGAVLVFVPRKAQPVEGVRASTAAMHRSKSPQPTVCAG